MLPKVSIKDKKNIPPWEDEQKARWNRAKKEEGKMGQKSEAQGTETIIKMTEAGITAYCESRNIPVEMLRNVSSKDLFIVKRYVKAMAAEMDRIIMDNIGPQLIRFWSRQGCPELQPPQE